jgi:tellurite resistance protein TerC
MIRHVKTVFTTIAGFTLLIIGAAMLVLPGPGIVVIGLGLVVLSAEFVWARRALDRMKAGAEQVRNQLKTGRSSTADRDVARK